jgi:hypothetical protein
VSQKVIAVLVIALTTAACVLGALWGVRFVNSAAPPPIIKFVKARGICFALMEHNDSVAMVEVDCNKLKKKN